MKRKFWAIPPKKLSPPLHDMEAWHRGPNGTGAAVYVIGTINGCYKIGNSVSPYKRLRDLRSLPVDLEMKAYIVSARAEWLERYLHMAFRDVRVRCEWFRLSDGDIATLAGLTHVSSKRAIPEVIRDRHDRNAAAAHKVAAERSLANTEERRAGASKPPRMSLRKWGMLIETGTLESFCKTHGITPPTTIMKVATEREGGG